jgi:hypothetical protein
MRNPFMRVATLLVATTLGCGLISSDVTKVTFDLPTKHYTFAAPAGIPTQAVPCGVPQGVPTCPSVGGVTLTCDNNVCTAHVPFTVHQTMNLKMEVPQLSSVNSQTLADITLESMSYAVTNTTQIAIPPIELYLAPDGVTDPSDSMAQKFATVPAVPAGQNASGDVVKEPGADDLFIMYGHNFGTSFNFIATTTVVIPSGTPTTGMVDVTINGKVAAKLSL